LTSRSPRSFPGCPREATRRPARPPPSLTSGQSTCRSCGDLELVIENGDNPPLQITGVKADVATYRLLFFVQPGAALKLYYGGNPDDPAPAYDTVALEAALTLFRSRVQPAICEFLDRESVVCAERATKQSVFEGQAGRPVILLELAGSKSEVREQSVAVLAWAAAHATGHRVARDRAEAEQLWAVRRKCSGAMFELGDAKLNEDIVIPMRSYVKFAKFLKKLKRTSGLHVPTFGHLADGNLHVNIMYHRADKTETRAAENAVQLLMETVVALGGAISGEHGIGLAKTPFLRIQHSPAQVRAMQAVKAALDPKGILNPGKMFDVFHVWKHTKIDVKFPWDHK
jgi:glycolate oxidase